MKLKAIVVKEVFTADLEGTVFVWKGDTRIRKMTIGAPVHSMRIILNPVTDFSDSKAEVKFACWVGTSHWLYLLDSSPATVTMIGKFPVGVSDLVQIDNKIWASSEKGDISIWDTERNAQLPDVIAPHQLRMTTAVASDGRILVWTAGADNQLTVFDGKTQTLLNRIELGDRATALVAIDDESQVWSASERLTMTRWHFTS